MRVPPNLAMPFLQNRLFLTISEECHKEIGINMWDWNNDYTKTAGNTIIYPIEEFL